VRLHLLLVVFDLGRLPHYDLRLRFYDTEAGIETSNEGLHFVFYPSLALVVAGLVLDGRSCTLKEAG
jgi:hypothetical protein